MEGNEGKKHLTTIYRDFNFQTEKATKDQSKNIFNIGRQRLTFLTKSNKY